MADYDFSPPSESEKKDIQSKYNLAPPTAEELAKFKEGGEGYSTAQQIKDFGRTLAQGATLGFSDEVLAAARALTEGGTYEQKVKEEREALERYAKEHPALATVTEVGAGILPALFTGGASAAAGAARTGIGAAAKIAAKEGAKFGAATALGKTEELAQKPFEAAKEVAIGGLTGAALGGVIGGGVQFAKELPSAKEAARKILPRTVAAYENALERGELVGSLKESRALSDSADALTGTLMEAKQIGSKRINDLIAEKTAEGAKVSGKEAEAIVEKLREIRPLIKDTTATPIDDLLQKYAAYEESVAPPKATQEAKKLLVPEGAGFKEVTVPVEAPLKTTVAESFEGFTPSELQEVKKIVSNLGYEASTDETISRILKNKIGATSEEIRSAIQKAAGEDYVALNSLQKELYETFEELLNKGQGTKVKTSSGEIKTVSKRKFNEGPLDERVLKLKDAVKNTVDKLKILTTGPDEYRTGYENFKTKLVQLFKKEFDLIESGVIKPEESFFSQNGIGNPEELFKLMEKISDISAARYGEIGEKVTGDPTLGILKDLAGYFTTEKGISKAAGYLGLGVRKIKGAPIPSEEASRILEGGRRALDKPIAEQPTPAITQPLSSKTSESLSIGRSLYGASPGAIGVLSSKLLENDSTKKYGEALKAAQIENNSLKKNATLFAAMQNPISREIIVRNSAETKREPASAEEAMDEEYINKRNRFIALQESGPGATEKEEFKAYSDTGGKRTIGHGYNLDAPGQYSKMKSILGLSKEEAENIYRGDQSISKKQADKLLSFSIDKAESELDRKLSEIGGVELTPNQRTALVSMIYNSPKLIGPKILNALKTGDYDEVARLISISSDWQAAKHPGLPGRRRKEAGVFSTPEEDSKD